MSDHHPKSLRDGPSFRRARRWKPPTTPAPKVDRWTPDAGGGQSFQSKSHLPRSLLPLTRSSSLFVRLSWP